jgi:hypothetical protein
MSIELIVTIAAIVITWLIFTWAIKVLKASITTALTVAIILIALQLFFGIQSQQIGKAIIHIGQIIWQFIVEL